MHYSACVSYDINTSKETDNTDPTLDHIGDNEVEVGQVSKYNPKLTPEEVASGRLQIAQDEKRLLSYILENIVKPPAPYNKNGFFIECGAHDDQFFSNTLPLELHHNWAGLLIEADPKPLASLLERNRIPGFLSTSRVLSKVKMLIHKTFQTGWTFQKGVGRYNGNKEDYREFEVQCFPLYSLLKAINVTTIDYFSLDIEGAELAVLKTIPWKSVLLERCLLKWWGRWVKK